MSVISPESTILTLPLKTTLSLHRPEVNHCSDVSVIAIRGGEEVILDFAGKDATSAFEDVGHSKEAQAQLDELQIGILDNAVCATLPPSLSTSQAGHL